MKLTLMIVATFCFTISFVSGGECASSTPNKQKSPPAASAPVKNGVVTTANPVSSMEFVLVKGGCFSMGDVFNDGEPNEKPVHEVCVADFFLGKYEVTQGQWEKIMGKNPSSRKECGQDCPVDNVSWNMVQEYIAALNAKGEGQYRLPTEAEWEYAARSGGLKEKWAGINIDTLLGNFAWYEKNSDMSTHKVGKKKPNGLGLHDMSGNVREWCQDWYDENYYSVSPKDNPSGPLTGQKRVLRGGIHAGDKNELRTVKRASDDIDVQDGDQGFRLVRIGR